MDSDHHLSHEGKLQKPIFFTFSLWAILALLVFAGKVFAAPPCQDGLGNNVPLDNERVLELKVKTQNQYQTRAHISGVVQDLYPERNGHYHFQVKIGPKEKDTIELVYNIEFGAIPSIVPGLAVESCGDYITSNAPTPQYEPSPDGAIIHWLHRSPRPARHPHGYLELNGVVYGN